MREVSFQRNYIKHPEGSCLASYGDTKVICTATIDNSQPPFLRETESGWLTAEYSMLPGSTIGRKRREIGKKDGRSTEIQRLIGRSLRAAVDLEKLGPITITIDCDVIQADGGTRTASISGAWVALYDALTKLAKIQGKENAEYYLKGQVAALSVGKFEGKIICDLDYFHDSNAEVDMNIVKINDNLVEIQGTGEKGTFNRDELNQLLDATDKGFKYIMKQQRKSLNLD